MRGNDIKGCRKPDEGCGSLWSGMCLHTGTSVFVPFLYAKRFVAYTPYDVSVHADGMYMKWMARTQESGDRLSCMKKIRLSVAGGFASAV